MKLKGIIDCDFVNYKKPCMTLMFPNCSFKCDHENGTNLCHNRGLALEPTLDIKIDTILDIYLENPLTEALVFQGLEPFDSWEDVQALVAAFRYYSGDPIVIYTGYTEEEIQDKLKWLAVYEDGSPVVVKFGRYRPNEEPHYDTILGVNLASSNQYAKEIKYEDYHK